MNIFFLYFTHAFITILTWILWSFILIKLKMANLSPFLFAQIDKMFENFVLRMNISNTNEHFTPILYTCINYTPPMYPVKYSPDQIQNGHHCPFCLLKLTKYLKILSVRINISNTNEYVFWILYTRINYNPPMYPVKFRPDQIQNSLLISSFVCSNWQNIWKLCPSVRMNISNTNEYLFLILKNPAINPYNLQQSFNPGDTIVLAIYLFSYI